MLYSLSYLLNILLFFAQSFLGHLRVRGKVQNFQLYKDTDNIPKIYLLVLTYCISNSFSACQNYFHSGFQNYFFYYGDENLVYLSVPSFLAAIFCTGLAIGVILAVGGLWVVQVSVRRTKTNTPSSLFSVASNGNSWRNCFGSQGFLKKYINLEIK